MRAAIDRQDTPAVTKARIYLDWNATAPLRPEARAAMAAAFDLPGNPSSVHSEGRAARHAVEEARAAVAAAVGASPRGVVFTSGGTEANALALVPGLRRDGGTLVGRLIVSAIEHPSVLAGGRFSCEAVTRAAVTPAGIIDLERLRALLVGGPPALVSVMLANNETGAIQPVRAVADLVHEAGGLLHVDAVQALGRIPVNFNELGADLLSVSAHKIGGPKGVGALVAAPGLLGLETGAGGQERGRRAGTENVPGIAGFGAAAAAAMRALPEAAAVMARLRNRLEAGLLAHSGVTVFAADVPRLPNTTLFAAPGLKAETAVIGLDLAGVAVSSGSACSSGKVQSSHVLEAMGADPALAAGAIRLSLGWSTTEADVDAALEAWTRLGKPLIKDRANPALAGAREG